MADIRHRQGRLLGRMEGLGFSLQKEAELETLTLDVVKSSEIEGETLDADQVRSSIARRLGIETAGTVAVERDVEGVVEMMLDATQNFDKPLSDERLFGWHAALFPTGRSGMRKIIVGAWRNDADGPMQVVSGPVGKKKVHYEAPAARLLDREMSQFLRWANAPGDSIDAVLRAALAHVWFVTIHPFDDGNGRIARAIGDWQLARADGSAQRFYSMSTQICQERNDYYDILERTQRRTLDVTPWMEWFLACLGRAFDGCQRSRDSDKFSTLVGALGSGTGLFVWILMKMKMMAVGAVGNRARAVFQAPVGALCASMGAAASTAPALAVGTAFG